MGVFGGVVRQFVVDDKGCVMIAAFGLPQYSYEVRCYNLVMLDFVAFHMCLPLRQSLYI
jgi:hypothetical protein